mmetsp:Transcript_34947/g.53649  ORF Transcript_34947/g.53649 Transcript_34947/m.53649 type:complete len:493 (+) Transcript_34947:413-1891(+)
MNGQVPSLLDRPKHERIRSKAAALREVFYEGDPLTGLERDIERMYVTEKYTKQQKYKKRNSMRFKVVWSMSDFNRLQEQKNYRMNDMEYFGTSKPTFIPFDLDDSLSHMYTHQDIMKTNKVRRIFSYFTDTKAYQRGQKRSQMQSMILLQRILMYIDSWEFVNSMDIPNDFHINHSIANMHIWLLHQRLRDFSENKFAFQLREELIDAYNTMTSQEMDEVDVLRKAKKIEDLDNYMFAIRRNFDFHFYINGKSVENPYYKVDALVWSSIFHEKVPRYSEQVYKMSEYLIQHFKYLQSLKFTDIERGEVDWSAYKVPFNYQTKVERINPPLSEEDFQREHDSPYKVKKYHYSFRLPEELTEDNLQRTYINLCTNAFFHNKDKTVREENLDLDSLTSQEREKVIYKLKKELEDMSAVADHQDSFFSPVMKSPTQTQFGIWKKNLFIPLTDQLEEQAQRKFDEQNEAKRRAKEQNLAFRQEVSGLHDIDAQDRKL